MNPRKVIIIGKKKYVIISLNINYKIFVIDIATFNISFDLDTEIYSLKKVPIGHLKVD